MKKEILDINTLKAIKEKIEDLLIKESDRSETIRQLRVWLTDNIESGERIHPPVNYRIGGPDDPAVIRAFKQQSEVLPNYQRFMYIIWHHIEKNKITNEVVFFKDEKGQFAIDFRCYRSQVSMAPNCFNSCTEMIIASNKWY